jgi:MOSC domain-containing protein YiiM
VLRAGRAQIGDAVTVLDRPAHGVTVADVMAAVAGDRQRLPEIAGAREHLGARGKDWLDRITQASSR